MQGSTIWVTFRGTVVLSIQNWLLDLNFVLDPFGIDPAVQVHRGFLRAWKSLKTETEFALKNLTTRCPTCSVVFTGHSLGGGIATLAFMDLFHLLPKNPKLITFGSPRVGNIPFSDAFKRLPAEKYRLTWQSDFIADLPPDTLSWKGNFYHHVNTEVCYAKGLASMKICDGSGEDPTCHKSIPATFNLFDHFGYLEYNFLAGISHRCGLPF